MKKRSKKKPDCELLEAVQLAESKEADLYLRVENILWHRGWSYTSRTPGSVWLWEKKLPDGRTVLCHRDTAVTMEVELSGEEWPDAGE